MPCQKSSAQKWSGKKLSQLLERKDESMILEEHFMKVIRVTLVTDSDMQRVTFVSAAQHCPIVRN
jgi:hypothetical protein